MCKCANVKISKLANVKISKLANVQMSNLENDIRSNVDDTKIFPLMINGFVFDFKFQTAHLHIC